MTRNGNRVAYGGTSRRQHRGCCLRSLAATRRHVARPIAAGLLPGRLSFQSARDSMTEDEGRLQQIGTGRWIEASRPTPSIDGTSLILQIRRAAERDQVPVRVLDDEILGPPGLLLQGLVQGRAGGAELEVEWLSCASASVNRPPRIAASLDRAWRGRASLMRWATGKYPSRCQRRTSFACFLRFSRLGIGALR